MFISRSISSRENLLISLSMRWSSSSCTTLFLFFIRGILCELSIFPKGGLFSPPPMELLLVTFLVGWVVGALLQDVVVLGVTIGD